MHLLTNRQSSLLISTLHYCIVMQLNCLFCLYKRVNVIYLEIKISCNVSKTIKHVIAVYCKHVGSMLKKIQNCFTYCFDSWLPLKSGVQIHTIFFSLSKDSKSSLFVMKQQVIG